MASTSALVAIVERMKERLVKENPNILKRPKAKRSSRNLRKPNKHTPHQG
jgi:hypothetical protein